jgi:hypothetical protein
MEAIPTLETQRLRLRPLTLNDAAVVQLLASTPEVADTTSSATPPRAG